MAPIVAATAQPVSETAGKREARFGGARGVAGFPCDMDSKQLLSSSPAGAYTTMRTVGRTAVFELGFHIQRLADTTRLMMEDAGESGVPGALSCLVDADALRPLVLESLRAAVRQFDELNTEFDPEGELRPTVLLTWQPDGSFEIVSHVGPLPPRPSSPVLVQVAGAPRSNAAAKNSEWVRERADLEKNAPAGCNEVLLMSPSGAIYEGLSSNFFAYQDGAIHTAQAGVLLGTVREMVLKVAAQEGIPVVLQPPNVASVESWEGAFVTSTSRLMLCVDTLLLPGGEGPVVFSENPVLRHLEQLVMQEIASNSESYM